MGDPIRGRGTFTNREGRFEKYRLEVIHDGWEMETETVRPTTEVASDNARTIITTNQSPDVPFDRSVNPYKGCEHGCVYCFARPTHSYLGLSPGLDFETRIFAKPNAPELLRAAFEKNGYRAQPLALGANTDAYQPAERRLGITRGILQVLHDYRHPVGILTKSELVLRDLDLLVPMAAQNLAHVFVSITTLDGDLARRMEPRAAAPHRRVETLRRLSEAGVPCGVLASPMIPCINDHEVERILEAAFGAGARRAGTIVLRLPNELKELFEEWLQAHYPGRAQRVLARLREAHGGKLYDSGFSERMRGRGPYAEMLRRRFEASQRKLGFERERFPFDTTRFQRPDSSPQLQLF